MKREVKSKIKFFQLMILIAICSFTSFSFADEYTDAGILPPQYNAGRDTKQIIGSSHTIVNIHDIGNVYVQSDLDNLYRIKSEGDRGFANLPGSILPCEVSYSLVYDEDLKKAEVKKIVLESQTDGNAVMNTEVYVFNSKKDFSKYELSESTDTSNVKSLIAECEIDADTKRVIFITDYDITLEGSEKHTKDRLVYVIDIDEKQGGFIQYETALILMASVPVIAFFTAAIINSKIKKKRRSKMS